MNKAMRIHAVISKTGVILYWSTSKSAVEAQVDVKEWNPLWEGCVVILMLYGAITTKETLNSPSY